MVYNDAGDRGGGGERRRRGGDVGRCGGRAAATVTKQRGCVRRAAAYAAAARGGLFVLNIVCNCALATPAQVQVPGTREVPQLDSSDVVMLRIVLNPFAWGDQPCRVVFVRPCFAAISC